MSKYPNCLEATEIHVIQSEFTAVNKKQKTKMFYMLTKRMNNIITWLYLLFQRWRDWIM